ncbi:hypothetical protein PTBPS01_25660 [Burkholderia pseudomallei]|nr:hypothetical protein PTBPS01_25660 [Burkholderia pseudomallei]
MLSESCGCAAASIDESAAPAASTPAPPASAATRGARRAAAPPRRNGVSMKRYDAVASAHATSSALALPPAESSPSVQRNTTKTGQCHR